MLRKVSLEAPAKINLYLEVGSLRPDGYHAVRTVLQAVDICDIVQVELLEKGTAMELEIEGDAPAGEENLCLQAAEAYARAIEGSPGMVIRLNKRIPRAAGLGGGSSDAAAVLRALDFLMEDALGGEGLFRLAASLGSDVPFFLVGGTALGEGRGERITPLVQAPPLPVVLVNPGAELSAGEVYKRFELGGGDSPTAEGPGALVDALAWGNVVEIAGLLYNSLQKAAGRMVPELGELMERARQAGAEGVLVSGSGPTIFLLAASDEEAASLERKMGEYAPVVLRTRFRSSGVSMQPISEE